MCSNKYDLTWIRCVWKRYSLAPYVSGRLTQVAMAQVFNIFNKMAGLAPGVLPLAP